MIQELLASLLDIGLATLQAFAGGTWAKLLSVIVRCFDSIACCRVPNLRRCGANRCITPFGRFTASCGVPGQQTTQINNFTRVLVLRVLVTK
jgi:hypothetical protein